ncbi:30S ribosomal protein S16 [Microvenator marinus]|jgi:small subunit ribosomal protein S16|uniref:Small ribosomal subunit protein bS16 n=1 Tax=Microvenator marinus TaxID=2600177 RepID=A0A5B8XP83_9DELT|nr:30S ribosomal protein S16 [Microvenator marinus]
MAVRLRLQRGGAKKRPFYRVVVADKRSPRDGRYIEMLGTYDPNHNPPIIRLNTERVDYWIGTGASPSETVNALIKKVANGEGVDLAKADAEKAALEARKAEKAAKLEELRLATLKAHEEAAQASAKAAEEAAKAAEAEAAAAAAAAAAPAEEAPAEAAEGEAAEAAETTDAPAEEAE